MKKGRGKKAGKRKDLDEFCELARKLGAKDAKIVAAKDVFTAQWVNHSRIGLCCAICPNIVHNNRIPKPPIKSSH